MFHEVLRMPVYRQSRLIHIHTPMPKISAWVAMQCFDSFFSVHVKPYYVHHGQSAVYGNAGQLVPARFVMRV